MIQHLIAFFSHRRLLSITMMLVAAGFVAGCSHNRSSYRPVYTSPTSGGCTNCGSSRGTVTTDDSISTPSTLVPSLSGPSASSDVPSPSSSIQRNSGSSSSTPPEPPPSAKIGQEPEYDAIPTTPTKSSSPKSTTSKSSQGPQLQGPNSVNSTKSSSLDRLEARQVRTTSAEADRRTSLGNRLQPYVAGSSERELFYPNKADRPWRYIVLHHSAAASGNYDQIDREHRKVLGYDGCGYHFVIGNGAGSADGQIEVAQRWDNQKQGVHCRNAKSQDMDEYGIGICLVGDLDQQAPTPRQIEATQALVSYLSQRYRIEPNHVSTHAHLASTPTVCPGKFFPEKLMNTTTKAASQNLAPRTTWNADQFLTMSR